MRNLLASSYQFREIDASFVVAWYFSRASVDCILIDWPFAFFKEPWLGLEVTRAVMTPQSLNHQGITILDLNVYLPAKIPHYSTCINQYR